MILTCPSCGTQYVVKDGAIPPQGRQVRCASCKHSWHQDADQPAELQMGPEMQPAEPGDADQSFAEATMIEPSSGPEAEERAYEEAAIEDATAGGAPFADVASDSASQATRTLDHATAAMPDDARDYDRPPIGQARLDDDFSPFAERGYAETRQRGPLLTILLVLALIVALAAAFWFLAPSEWKARLGLADAAATPLELSNPPHVERTPLASGNELLTVAGRVINPTNKTQTVPPIYAQIRNHAGQVIYKWTIAPPTPSLAPGASASFNSAEVNVPGGGEDLTISLGPPKA